MTTFAFVPTNEGTAYSLADCGSRVGCEAYLERFCEEEALLHVVALRVLVVYVDEPCVAALYTAVLL